MRSATRQAFGGSLLVVLFTVLLYQPALDGDFLWDDDANVTENALLQGDRQLLRIWTSGESYQYYPLTFSSYWLQARLWNLDARSCHWVNVVLHALAAVLLFLLVRQLGLSGALWGALLFAVHPVCVESVAWITERKNVLAGVFYLLSLLFFVRFHRAGEEGRGRDYAVSLVAFSLAALAKTHTVMLPGVLVIYLWWTKSELTRSTLLRLLPFFVLAAVLALVTVSFESGHVTRDSGGTEWQTSLVDRLMVAARIPWFYVGKLLWPQELIFIYPRWSLPAGTLASWLPLLGLLAIAGAAALMLRATKLEARGRALAAALAYVLVTLLPVSGVLDVYFMRYSFVQDHFQYFTAMGVLTFLAAALGPVRVRHWPALAMVLLSVVSWRHQADFKDLETLWQNTLRKNPDAWMASTNLGILRMEQGQLEEAIELHRRALHLAPHVAEPHNNLGAALECEGRLEEAANHYRKAIEVEPYDPVSYFNLGNVLVQQEELREAIPQYEKALDIEPQYARALSNLGTAWARSGDLTQAIGYWRETLSLAPGYKDAYGNLIKALWQTGQAQAALQAMRDAHRQAPEDRHLALELAMHLVALPDPTLRNAEEAQAIAQKLALQTRYKDPVILDLLAAVHAEQGDFDKAIHRAQQAAELVQEQGFAELAEQIEQRLRLYRDQKPFRRN
jgi:Flp pilus assembly protein TadD